jgi:hypothetical protein
MSGSSVARVGIVLGVLALLAIPAGILAAWYRAEVSLIEALEVAVAAAFLLGLAALSLVRRARYRVARSVSRTGDRSVRVGGVLAWSGVYAAVVGAVALGFYGLLVIRG